MEVDHYCESKFVFHTLNEEIYKTINHFYLETKMLDENMVNDNYEKNRKYILNTLYKLIQKEIK